MSGMPPPPFFVQPSPAGGYRVMLREHPRPVSHHDTEEEAELWMSAHFRGWILTEAQARQGGSSP